MPSLDDVSRISAPAGRSRTFRMIGSPSPSYIGSSRWSYTGSHLPFSISSRGPCGPIVQTEPLAPSGVMIVHS